MKIQDLSPQLQESLDIKLMGALDINRANFYKRMRGDVEPKVSEAAAIELVFKQYGITEIWG